MLGSYQNMRNGMTVEAADRAAQRERNYQRALAALAAIALKDNGEIGKFADETLKAIALNNG